MFTFYGADFRPMAQTSDVGTFLALRNSCAMVSYQKRDGSEIILEMTHRVIHDKDSLHSVSSDLISKS